MNENEIAIQCKGIKKTYGDHETKIEALKNIDLDVEKGKLTLLVGPSGSGKTTLLSIITTILTPDEGQLLLLGKDTNLMSDTEKSKFCLDNLGIVFQSLFLVPTLTVLENISLPLLIAGMDEQEAHKRGQELLDKMGLANRGNVSPSQLSKGQQQRVAIARAMVNQSKILICDEPTSALDQATGLTIMSLLKEIAHDTSRAVLVVTHDHRTFPFADRIVTISDGQILSGNEHE